MEAHAHPTGRAADRPRYELADIVRAHGEDYARTHVLTPDQHDVLRALVRCRTADLGGYVDVCDSCGQQVIAYNSCRNRHCPKCQALAQARWIAQRMDRVLPTHSFHVVFTLPSELRALAMVNRELIFTLLFTCAAQTLLELARDPKRLGAELGITSVLHTWTRELLFHPHVHSIVTGGGLSLDGTRWVETKPDFLFPVRVIGALFRGKFLDGLLRAHARGELVLQGPAAKLADPRRFACLRDKLCRMRWVVYAKPPFGGPEQVFRYLGRYTHRVGLSNQRLLSIDERGVTFRTKGDGTATVSPEVLLGRFLLHILPKGFVKIRHYGLMAASNVSTKLAAARRLLAPPTNEPATPRAPQDFRELLLALTGVDLRRCPRCGRTMTRHPLAILEDGAASAVPVHDTS
jgi:hypothetical protein